MENIAPADHAYVCERIETAIDALTPAARRNGIRHESRLFCDGVRAARLPLRVAVADFTFGVLAAARNGPVEDARHPHSWDCHVCCARRVCGLAGARDSKVMENPRLRNGPEVARSCALYNAALKH
ncbi:hypothetical protein LJ656_12795 [Paraburkholderia sp. MMS20-SJTR3]|uniref:Uncharacterized protein n=1 Tax=Paraburkholderia sejongensis TaxID=2886946 RepID=A0ABS8JU89_9BURK|nr:hypothetical protein [Paraburkholderia sp. MMS20-SJTR3]MCC8393471.1 hypothetical protein [Paraburkholderia sp. MMS20-SJTR3]